MELVRPGTYIDFMRHRAPVVGVSLLLVGISIVSFWVPGPKLGIDFAGGAEMQVEFGGDVSSSQLRAALQSVGEERPDVVQVQGHANEFIIRVQAVGDAEVARRNGAYREALDAALGDTQIQILETSPGLDKVKMQLSAMASPDALQTAIESAGGRVREVVAVGRSEDHRYEVHLFGIAHDLLDRLRNEMGERGPSVEKRIEWVGARAGEQLRDAAIQSLLYCIAFIMVYVALRFDLRFAPGAVIAMLHDVLITGGIYVLVQREVNLTTIAALLTILGYSINDTIVVYDRIRENMGRLRDRSLRELINISTSQMLSRTIITSGTTLLSIAAFFIFGTAVIQDISFALFVGILIGTYSSVYVAAPVTEWIDRRFFVKQKAR